MTLSHSLEVSTTATSLPTLTPATTPSQSLAATPTLAVTRATETMSAMDTLSEPRTQTAEATLTDVPPMTPTTSLSVRGMSRSTSLPDTESAPLTLTPDVPVTHSPTDSLVAPRTLSRSSFTLGLSRSGTHDSSISVPPLVTSSRSSLVTRSRQKGTFTVSLTRPRTTHPPTTLPPATTLPPPLTTTTRAPNRTTSAVPQTTSVPTTRGPGTKYQLTLACGTPPLEAARFLAQQLGIRVEDITIDEVGPCSGNTTRPVDVTIYGNATGIDHIPRNNMSGAGIVDIRSAAEDRSLGSDSKLTGLLLVAAFGLLLLAALLILMVVRRRRQAAAVRRKRERAHDTDLPLLTPSKNNMQFSIAAEEELLSLRAEPDMFESDCGNKMPTQFNGIAMPPPLLALPDRGSGDLMDVQVDDPIEQALMSLGRPHPPQQGSNSNGASSIGRINPLAWHC